MSQPYPAHYPPPPPPARRKRKAWPWVLGVIGVLMVVMFGSCMAAVNDAVEDAKKPVTITYEVTGDAPKVTIMYTTYSGGGWSSNTEDVTTLPAGPWTKTAEAEGFSAGGSLIVSTGMEGGTVTCKVTIDGKEAKTATATGQIASASCTGF